MIIFLNDEILSEYFKKISQNNKELSYSLLSFNGSQYLNKTKIFLSKTRFKKKLEKKLNLRIDQIENESINVCLRLRNKNFKILIEQIIYEIRVLKT